MSFELSYVFKAVQSISGKAADGLGDYHINFTGHTGFNHSVKLGSVLCVGAGDAVIGIDPRKSPFRIIADVLGIVLHLSFITGGLLISVGAYSAVGRNAQFRSFFNTGFAFCSVRICRYNLYVSHSFSP